MKSFLKFLFALPLFTVTLGVSFLADLLMRWSLEVLKWIDE